MLKTLFTILAAIAAAALMSVCPTLVEARSAKGACLSHENRSERYMLAQRGMTPFSDAENVAVFVESVNGANRTRAEVVSKKLMATSVFAPDWSKGALDKLCEKLK